MKHLTFVDQPVYVSKKIYDESIHGMKEILKKLPGVVSIYQVGSTADPGISDIDLMVVFEDGTRTDVNPLENLPKLGKYLFVHQLFGLHESNYKQGKDYFFFHNCHLIHGKNLEVESLGLSETDTKIVKRQIAYEYFFKSYITLTVLLTYRIVKVRPLLLEAKANIYDLEFLGVKSGKLFDLVNILINWRSNWFDAPPTRPEVVEWLEEFYRELESFLKENLGKGGFHHIQSEKYRFSRNVFIRNHSELFFSHKGFRFFPALAALLGKKYFNLHHRFNSFVFYIPVKDVSTHWVLKKKLEFETFCTEFNKKYIPFFAPLKSSLDISLMYS